MNSKDRTCHPLSLSESTGVLSGLLTAHSGTSSSLWRDAIGVFLKEFAETPWEGTHAHTCFRLQPRLGASFGPNFGLPWKPPGAFGALGGHLKLVLCVLDHGWTLYRAPNDSGGCKRPHRPPKPARLPKLGWRRERADVVDPIPWKTVAVSFCNALIAGL